MPIIPYNDWCDEDVYMDEMARMHKLTPKLNIIRTLKREFDRIQSDPDYEKNLSKEERQWRLVELSGQIVALFLELTDDLAAVCAAYSKPNKRVIERIANFKLGDGHRFYEAVANDANIAAQMAGLYTPSDREKEEVRQRFLQIKKMRDHFWKWYTGYKHGQYATPIVITMESSGQKIQEWGLYLVPKRLRSDGAGRVHTEDRFINTVGNVNMFGALAEEVVRLWVEVRNRQYPKIFGRTLV